MKQKKEKAEEEEQQQQQQLTVPSGIKGSASLAMLCLALTIFFTQ